MLDRRSLFPLGVDVATPALTRVGMLGARARSIAHPMRFPPRSSAPGGSAEGFYPAEPGRPEFDYSNFNEGQCLIERTQNESSSALVAV